MSQKQEQKLKDVELQFYVYQDLSNVVGILAETCVAINYLNSFNPQHPYINIAKNRLIAQFNISNAVQTDQYYNAQQQQGKLEQLNNLKQNAKTQFQNIVKNNEFFPRLPDDDIVNMVINQYQTLNLSELPRIQQMVPVHTQIQSNFNQNTLQQVIIGLQSTDNQINQVQQGNYKQPTLEELKQIIKDRVQNASILLQRNFPQEQSQGVQTLQGDQNQKAEINQVENGSVQTEENKQSTDSGRGIEQGDKQKEQQDKQQEQQDKQKEQQDKQQEQQDKQQEQQDKQQEQQNKQKEQQDKQQEQQNKQQEQQDQKIDNENQIKKDILKDDIKLVENDPQSKVNNQEITNLENKNNEEAKVPQTNKADDNNTDNNLSANPIASENHQEDGSKHKQQEKDQETQ